MTLKQTNVRKDSIQKEDVVKKCKSMVLSAVTNANRSAFFGDVKENSFWCGHVQATLDMLQYMGFSVESTVKMNEDYTIQTIENVRIDNVDWYGRAAQ